jgi:hypothetical protein
MARSLCITQKQQGELLAARRLICEEQPHSPLTICPHSSDACPPANYWDNSDFNGSRTAERLACSEMTAMALSTDSNTAFTLVVGHLPRSSRFQLQRVKEENLKSSPR